MSSLILASICMIASCTRGADAFAPVYSFASKTSTSALNAENKLTLIDDPDTVAAPVAFRLSDATKKTDGEEAVIMCHIDCIAKINDVDYVIGFPADHAVDIAYVEEDDDGEEGLVLIETDDPLMDKLFPIAKDLVQQDEDAKLALYRTPATLTLAGNLAMDNDEDEDEDDEEEVADLLLTFECEGKEYDLVRPTDLMLLVGKEDGDNKEQRVLIDDEESEQIMPTLMEMLGI
eukprot:CAMPEP_0181038660 /NCGR_PEP_ID=MMETSP1070-20121207/10050_1 /TAXON_ID=265543 /ORGANISM="Minutocellus polymorphus, Strain NH13" /LENGTH=232 /DNA_ID=CAMNT_0023116451 /DNA_START=171 /DNA_END=869 /DNA_ORIENTATION=+